MSRAARMEGAQALTTAERDLLDNTHFDLTVAVSASNGNPIHRDALIGDLEARNLFDAVVAADNSVNPDLVAVRTGGHVGNRTGVAFTLASAAAPENTISISVNYYIAPIWEVWANRSERRQYHDRLAVEVIRAVNQLLEPETGRSP